MRPFFQTVRLRDGTIARIPSRLMESVLAGSDPDPRLVALCEVVNDATVDDATQKAEEDVMRRCVAILRSDLGIEEKLLRIKNTCFLFLEKQDKGLPVTATSDGDDITMTAESFAAKLMGRPSPSPRKVSPAQRFAERLVGRDVVARRLLESGRAIR